MTKMYNYIFILTVMAAPFPWSAPSKPADSTVQKPAETATITQEKTLDGDQNMPATQQQEQQPAPAPLGQPMPVQEDQPTTYNPNIAGDMNFPMSNPLQLNPTVIPDLSTDPNSLQSFTLTPTAICTEMGCPADAPCCNTCSFNGWSVKELGVIAQSLERPFPLCVPDGCGQCSFTIQVTGHADNPQKPNVFYVTQWSQIGGQPATPAMPIELAPQAQNAEVSEEERQRAMQNWLQQLQQQSNTNMETLKKENPQQYQQMQNFLNT